MATIEKRKEQDGTLGYRVKIRLKGHSPESATFARLTDAKRWAAQTESAIRDGRYFQSAEGKKKSLSQAIDKYLDEIAPRLKDAGHRQSHLMWWSKEIGDLMLTDVTHAIIAECRDKLRKMPSVSGKHKGNFRTDSTVNRYLASLSPVFTAAVREWSWVDSNPCERVSRGRESKGRTRFLSRDEQTALIAACNQFNDMPEIKIIVLIALTTGCRRGEIMKLRWKHIDFQRCRLTLEDTKNGETRSVPIVGPALSALKKWATVRPLYKECLVFPGHSDRTKQKPLDFEVEWQAIKKAAGLADFRFHDLRHTAASYLAMNGAGLREIADILGHKTLAMVQRYSHLCDDHKAATISRMVDAMITIE